VVAGFPRQLISCTPQQRGEHGNGAELQDVNAGPPTDLDLRRSYEAGRDDMRVKIEVVAYEPVGPCSVSERKSDNLPWSMNA
jgi:hypothetical protein